MKVKVGDKIHDSENEPVMVILSEQDKENIANMNPKANKYCVYPDGKEWEKNDYKKIKDWMKISMSEEIPEKRKEQRIATLEDWYSKIDKPCQSLKVCGQTSENPNAISNSVALS